MSSVDEAIAAIRAGEPVVLPFDTVYGLAAREDEDSTRRLYALKGRVAQQPTALVATDTESLIELVPELDTTVLLRGPFTLIVPNPAHRFPWLTGTKPATIGVRLPELAGPAAAVLAAVRVVAATSANHPGGADPKQLAAVPEDIRTGAGAVIDGGDLPGKPSTVVDLTGAEPRILREGAVPTLEVLARIKSSRTA